MARKHDLLTTGNPKTDKGRAFGYSTAILHLAPHALSGRNVCPWATPGCIAGCLNTAGRGGIASTFDANGMPDNVIQRARIRRTQEFFGDRGAFLDRLAHEIALHARAARYDGLQAAVRLNGTSDLPWERIAPELFAVESVQFYDYTKSAQRMARFLRGELPRNYHLTFSLSESVSSEIDADWILQAGGNVAMVCSPEVYAAAVRCGVAIDGDRSDLRFLDAPGVPVALKAKGRAKRDTTGFVLR